MPGLDINWFRVDKGYDPDVIRKSLEKRFKDIKIVDDIIEKDAQWRKCIIFVSCSKISVRYVEQGMEFYWGSY
jgi:seryl-tRNA synthetase